jgi:hypothetical protein
MRHLASIYTRHIVPASAALLLTAAAITAPVTAQTSAPQTQGTPGGQGRTGRGSFGFVPALTETGFREIFDGKSLDGWDCDKDFWRVENGELVGETTVQHQPVQNIFCIWKGGEPADFELKLEYKLTGVNNGNSGIQYRSIERPDVAKWVLQGYQADIDLQQMFTGQIYEERARGFLARRGMMSYVPADGKPGSIGKLGEEGELKASIHDNDWNEIHIIARGNTIVQLINGRVMSAVIDDDPKGRKMSGKIGIQLHRLPNCSMKMESRKIRLKTF